MTGTGLKKWRPRTRSGFGSPPASSAIAIEEVLEASRHSGETTPATSAKIERFSARFSGTASITRSALARSPSSAV